MAESTKGSAPRVLLAPNAPRGARDGAGLRCALCGAPNDCGLAGGETGAPCWCVGRTFPAALLERARAVDGGAACVCRVCLAAAERKVEAKAEAESAVATAVGTGA
ncbi:MAG: cysteine-rich CWC family protein [Myxococcota bacterium]